MQEAGDLHLGGDDVIHKLKEHWEGHPVSRIKLEHVLEETIHLLPKGPS